MDPLLIFEHPEVAPVYKGRLSYLINEPSIFAPTSRYKRFWNQTLTPMLESRPKDTDLIKLLHNTNEVLMWRESIPVDLRFWID